MFLKKFCYFICAIFLIQNLYDIYKNSNSVQYVIKKDKIENDIVFSFCIELNQKLLENFKNSNNEYQFKVKDLLEHTCNRFFSKSTCINLIDLKRSYLFNYHSCLIFNNKDFDTLITNLTSIDFHIFLISDNRSQLYFQENIFSNKNAAFKLNNKLSPFTLNVNYYKINYLESPYQTDCFNYSNSNVNIKSKELIYSRASYLIECFKVKSKYRSLNYYYSRRDDELLFVTKDELNQLKEIGQRMLFDKNLTTDQLLKCINKLSKTSCKFQHYLIDQFKDIKQTKFNLTYDLKIYSAIPSITKYQFIINFINLIILFLNISFFETIPFLIKKIFSIYFKKYLILFKKKYWLVRLVVLILCFSIVISLSVFRIIDYNNKHHNRLEAFNFPTEILPFYLMICVPVQILIYNNNNKLDELVEMSLLKSKSFIEIESLTNFTEFGKNLGKIFIQYRSNEKPINFKIDRTKIVFKYFNFEFENYRKPKFLLRCYKIDFDFKETRYEMLFSLSKLIIILKFNWYIIYPLSKHQNLTTEDSYLNSNNFFFKKNYRKKFDCLDYSKHRLFYNFSSRKNLIDNCVNFKHLGKYNNLTIQSVIYKEMILLKNDLNNIYFNYNLDKNIYEECSKKFKRSPNCFKQVFQTNKAKPINQANNQFIMYLYYPEYLISDNLVLTSSDLLLNNLLSFESIFIGLNIGKIFLILFILLKRYKFNIMLKYYNYLRIFVLLIGLSIHFYLIINDILEGEFIFEQKFSHLLSTYQPPNLIFCFEFNKKDIDYNYRQTTNYLDNLTKNLNLNLFQNISLVNVTYDKIIFEPNKLETFNYLKKIYTLYYYNLKCFEFIFKPIDCVNLYLLNELNFINIKFNQTKMIEYFKRSSFEIYFISKPELTHEINGINRITINYKSNNSYPLIIIDQKLKILQVEEKFSYIKNPLAIFYSLVNLNDTTDYINKTINDFQEFNLKTKRIPTISNDYSYFNDKNNNLEIDDELFDQYYYQIKNVTDFYSFRELDFTREIYFTYIREGETQNNNDYNLKFFFDLDFQKYMYTNRDNHSKFIISILNCLNIWLNFCCFDLYIYFQKFLNLIYKFNQLLLRFKFCLKQKRSHLLAQLL